MTTKSNTDGSLQSRTGTAVTNEYHSYGVGTYSNAGRTVPAAKWHRVDIGQTSSPRWKRTWRDWAGREIAVEQPGFTGQPDTVEESFYDQIASPIAVVSPGRLLKTTKTGYAPTLYQYDSHGKLLRSGLDVDNNGLVLASADRVTETITDMEGDVNGYWLRKDTYTYPHSGNATRVLVESIRKRVDTFGYLSSESETIDVNGNKTNEKVLVDRANRVITKTVTRVGIGNPQVEVSTNGLMTSTTGFDGLTIKTYYDALLRKSRVEDSRGNTTTFAYISGTTLLQTVTDAGGYVAATGYDALGRVRWKRDQQNRFTYTSQSRPIGSGHDDTTACTGT